MRTPSAKFVTIIPVLLLLAACTDTSSDYARLSKLVLGEFGGTTEVSRDQAAAVPYATIGVKIGGSSQNLMVLATVSGDERLWLAGTDAAITTRGGRIVHTVGFVNDLKGVTLVSQDGGVSSYLYDLVKPTVYGVLVKCVERDLGMQSIMIIGAQIQTRHFSQECEAPTLGWSFTNEFWKDANTGYVWRSIQNTNPQADALQIDVLRPEDAQ